jgi:uncharacterized protein YidB (DUF937 family)
MTGSNLHSSVSLLDGLLEMLLNKEGQKSGLESLVESFQEKQMGDLIGSWIGTGANLFASPELIRIGLGEERIQRLAAKTGQSPGVVTLNLTILLPRVIDSLTPLGRIPEPELLIQCLKFVRSGFPSQKERSS